MMKRTAPPACIVLLLAACGSDPAVPSQADTVAPTDTAAIADADTTPALDGISTADVTLPAGALACYVGDACTPGAGDCGAGGTCHFDGAHFVCRTSPVATAGPGDFCSAVAGPACRDGLYCSPATEHCVALCCSASDCDDNAPCEPVAVGLSACRPAPSLACYQGQGLCNPGEQQCGPGANCDWNGTAFECFPDPPATADRDEPCDAIAGPACLDGLTCDPFRKVCAAMCCTSEACPTDHSCVEATAGLSVCLPDLPTDGPVELACLQYKGNCIPGEHQCGPDAACDWANGGFQCFSTPAATAALGEACDNTNGPSCVDGLSCDPTRGVCAAKCCDTTDCGPDEVCDEAEPGISVCLPELPTTGEVELLCYQGHGPCIPGEQQCGPAGQCDFANGGFQCFSSPPATAAVGQACNNSSGPSCKDGLSCNPTTQTCVAMCCAVTDCAGDEVCSEVTTGLSVCLPDVPVTGDIELACYQNKGTCIPGEQQCGATGQCDYNGSGFQCFTSPPATATLGQACNTSSGPACKDGMVCHPSTHVCVEMCCDDTNCTTGTCTNVTTGLSVCL